MKSTENNLLTSAIDFDNNYLSGLIYAPKFISNDYKNGRKVLSEIESELLKCKEFIISVAFITDNGIAPLLQTLKELEQRNIKGKILTTNYLFFSEPKALKRLFEFDNIELKMYFSNDSHIGFHTKGYVFKYDNCYHIITGSSNITASALTLNYEWNTKVISSKDNDYVLDLLSEFDRLWNDPHTYPYEHFIDLYAQQYIEQEKKRKVHEAIISLATKELKPNSMQRAFIQSLDQIQKSGNNKALLISATGTGKTYASAFALKYNNPTKALFLVHREQIAKQALNSYRNVFGDTKSFGLLSGNHKDVNSDYLFATMQTMSKPDVYQSFDREVFDIIVIDEAHRIGATSYQNIINYFKPKFWLGMTASPERTDNFDVYATFDHNIAYEIRLQQALEENLLCPFHYFGITDIIIAEREFEETKLEDFRFLASDERVNYIIEQAEYYGYSGNRVKGLIFCSSKKECALLSEKMNQKGYSTIHLSGENTQEERERAIERLVCDNESNKLDYILTVDIFNEGVDIPEINQVILLRPTQSPIIFVQQLGRGLRKFKGKEYVVVLDFIGNYQNNFMIPIALSGDYSYNKDNIRRYVIEGDRIIPGASTIHFDEISKKQIFASIDSANFTDIKLIKDNYINLKNKLGRIPSLLDFDKYGEMDVMRIFDNKNLKCYYTFLVKYEKEYKIRLNQVELRFIEFISTKLSDGKRPHELMLLDILMNNNDDVINLLKTELDEKQIIYNQNTIQNIVNIMTNEFPSGTGKETFKECVFLSKQKDTYCISDIYKSLLDHDAFKAMVQELIVFGLSRNKRYYSNTYKNTNFVLYQKYTYEDVCRLLDWEHNEVPLNIGGYKYDSKTKTFPVFINYDKDSDIQDTIKYEDHFINSNQLIAISKSGRSLESDDVKNFLYARQKGIDVELFVRKNKDDKISKEFYYLGKMHTVPVKAKEFIMQNTEKSAVEIEWHLETAVREDIYEYITKG